jgi:hypothetical protein
MNYHKQRAIDRGVSSDEWIKKSKNAGHAAFAKAKKRKEAETIELAKWEKERQEYGVFLEVRNGKNAECMCNKSVAWQLGKGEAVYFSQPKIYNAANKLGLKVLDYDAANKTAVMVDEDGKSAVYEVKYAANMLRIQILRAVFRLPVHP